MRGADGNYCWHLAIAKFLHDEENASSLWVITLTNIHDQKVIDEKKDEFIGIASHELKTPLTSAKAYTQLLQSTLKGGENAEALHYVNKASIFIDRLNSLVSELLDITKIQHNKLQLTITEFDFDALLDETIEFIQASETTHIITKHGKANLIHGDAGRIQQVIINLLSNAIKYSPGSNHIELNVSGQSNSVTVSVIDEGIGIPGSDLEKVFERFYRVESNSSKFQGLGIGLFISAEIIKRHKGKMWVESESGKGAKFYFIIPKKQAQESK